MGEEQHVTETTIDGKSPDPSSSLQFFNFQDHEWWCNKIAEIGTPESYHHEAW
jgi:hypothetical protein